MHVEKVERIEQLSAYRDVWRTLLDETPDATFFQSLEWLEVYWKHFGGAQQLRVLLVYDNNVLLGILPLVVRKESTKVGNLRFLTYPLDYWGSYYGPIGPAPEVVLDAGLRFVHQQPRDWDVLELRWVGLDEADCDRTQAAMMKHGFAPVRTVLDHTALIRFNGTWDAYFGSRKHKWRHNYRRWSRRLAEHGHVEHVRYRPQGKQYGDGDPQWALYDACQAVARKSWQSRSPDGTTICHDSIRGFIHDAHAAAASIGALDVNLLTLDGTPIAFAYNYRCKNTIFGLRIGFDPTYKSCGVGNILYGMLVEDSFRRGDRLLDIGCGSLDWKRNILTHLQPVYRYSYFPVVSIRPQLLHAKRCLDASAAEKHTAAEPV